MSFYADYSILKTLATDKECNLFESNLIWWLNNETEIAHHYTWNYHSHLAIDMITIVVYRQEDAALIKLFHDIELTETTLLFV